MKAGWDEIKLGDAVTLNYGKALAKAERSPDGAIPVYGANGVMDWSDHQLTDGPSLVVGRKGSAGEITRVEGPFWPSDVTYYTSHDESRVDFDFLHYSLLTLNLPSMARGVKPGINRNDVYGLSIPLPPLEEQQQIVAVLDEAFEGLARARAHAEANLQNAGELFEASLRSIFGDESIGWPQITLPDVCVDFGRGKSRHRPRNDVTLYGGNIPFIQTGDLSNADHYITDFSQTYSERGLAQSKLWPVGTVCIAIVGATIGESGVLDFDACFPDSVIGMTANQDRADPEYIEFLLQFFKAELKEAGKGSARDNINLATFKDRHFPMPDVTTQKAISEKLKRLSSAANIMSLRYQEKLQDLDDLRQSLLQKAFAGELT